VPQPCLATVGMREPSVVIDVFAKKSFQLKPSTQGPDEAVALLRRRRVPTETKALEDEHNELQTVPSRDRRLYSNKQAEIRYREYFVREFST
jgi:hypothetical protein